MSLFKKVIIISIILNIIFAISYFFIKKIFFSNISPENNIVKVIKKAEIIESNSTIVTNNKNISENILSGFFINNNTIITAFHWTNWENADYEIIDINWNKYSWKLISQDKINDIAFIKIENKYNLFKNIKINKNIKVWENIYSISILDWKKTKYWKIIDIKNNIITSNILFNSWESGSPLFNENWEIIAINLEIDTEKNLWFSSTILTEE